MRNCGSLMQDGLLSGRADVVVAPFAGSLAHLFVRLEACVRTRA